MPISFQNLHSLRNANLLHLARLILRLAVHAIRGAPPQLHGVDLPAAVARVEDDYLLRDAVALLGGELAACLRLELQLEALSSLALFGCSGIGGVKIPW